MYFKQFAGSSELFVVFEYMHDYVTISANHQRANCEHNRHFPGCIKASTAEHQLFNLPSIHQHKIIHFDVFFFFFSFFSLYLHNSLHILVLSITIHLETCLT